MFQKLTGSLNEHCSGPKGPYDRWEERIPDQGQAAPVISLISRRTIPPHPRYVGGSDTIPRGGCVTTPLCDDRKVSNRVGRQADAAKIASQTESAAEALSSPLEKAEAFVALANIWEQVGERRQAVAAVCRAVEAAEAIDDARDRAVVHVNATRTLAETGQVDRALTVAETITSPTFKTRALLSVRLALAAAGEKERAVELAYRIATIAQTTENPSDRAQSFVTASQALGGVGEGGQATLALVNALLSARLAGRSSFFQTLQESVQLLCSIDGCQTIWKIHEALVEVDSWWSK